MIHVRNLLALTSTSDCVREVVRPQPLGFADMIHVKAACFPHLRHVRSRLHDLLLVRAGDNSSHG